MQNRMKTAAAAALAALTLCGAALAQTEAEKQAWQRIAQLGDGFLVWESSRTGSWRIWTRNLDGGGLRQLIPDEAGRDHFCPHLSPDGKQLLYLSYPKGKNSYSKDFQNFAAPLYLFNLQTNEARQIAENARAYFEDRAAVWIDNDRFIYIGGDGHTYKRDLKQNMPERLTAQPQKEFGQLINASMTHATRGRPEFSPYDPNAKAISQRQHRGGCQPYFTHNGVWGYWMGGAGGPVNRIHLETGTVNAILQKNDSRLPSERSYIYFPMISHRADLIAFGASPNQHDHFRSDYDIFVAPIDPNTLELSGEPARYTFDAKADRYPDVYLQDLELGRFEGEAPLQVRFQAPDSVPADMQSDMRWDMGEGTAKRGAAVSFTYEKPGSYDATASVGGKTLRGRVQVFPQTPPRVEYAAVQTKTSVRVQFSEPVNLDRFDASLQSGNKIVRVEAEAPDAARVVLEKPLEEADALRLSGAVDLAQQPNRMQPAQIPIKPPEWPLRPESALIAWMSGDPTAGGRPIQRKGSVPTEWDGALSFQNGSAAFPSVNEPLLQACRESSRLTVEAVFRTRAADQTGPARIVTFSSSASARNFTLGQQNDQIVFRLRTDATVNNSGGYREFALFKIEPYETVHAMVVYEPGRLAAYKNGERAFQTEQLTGGLGAWTSHYFLLGDEADGARQWNGAVEAFAVRSEALSADEARLSYEDYRNIQRRKRAESGGEWPLNRDRLVFLWKNAQHPNIVQNEEATLAPRGTARLTGDYAMELEGGSFAADRNAARRLLNAAKATNQIAVEAFLQTDRLDQNGPARIVTFSDGASSRNFTLGQEGGQLIFRLRTPSAGTNGTNPQTPVARVFRGKPTHIIVTYRPGLLVCYQDGKQVRRSAAVNGGFENWEPLNLLFGDESSGGRDWAGRLEGVALYARWIGPEEAEQNHAAYRAEVESRNRPKPLAVKARLTKVSRTPTLEEINPYREALVVYEYEAVQPLNGAAAPTKIRAAHWAVLDGKKLDAAQWKTGTTREFRIEPFEANPQLEAYYISDTLELDVDIPLYYVLDI